MGKQYYPKCAELKRTGFCTRGCKIINGKKVIMCHKFQRGECGGTGDRCDHGLHRKPRGDGFRPYSEDTSQETELKKHLAELMLSPRKEDLADLDSEIVDMLYKKLSLKRHPDKVGNQASCTRFIQLQNAKDYVKENLPFSS